MEINPDEPKLLTGKLQNLGRGQTSTNTERTSTLPSSGDRKTRKNLIYENERVRSDLKNCTSAKAAWKLFFNVKMLMIVVDMTNQNIAEVKVQLPETTPSDVSRSYVFHSTNLAEVLVFISLVYLWDILGQAICFNSLTGSPIFGDTVQ